MTVTEVKHAAKRQEWQARIKECRSSGETVQQWCAERQISATTYYRWEREVFGRVGRQSKGSQALAETVPEFAEAPAVKTYGAPWRAVMTVRIGEMAVDIYTGAQEEEIQAVCRILKQC